MRVLHGEFIGVAPEGNIEKDTQDTPRRRVNILMHNYII